MIYFHYEHIFQNIAIKYKQAAGYMLARLQGKNTLPGLRFLYWYGFCLIKVSAQTIIGRYADSIVSLDVAMDDIIINVIQYAAQFIDLLFDEADHRQTDLWDFKSWGFCSFSTKLFIDKPIFLL